MATITYAFELDSTLNFSAPPAAGDQIMPSLTRLAGGSILELWNTGGTDTIQARSFTGFSPQPQLGFTNIQVNSTAAGQQFGADAAGLTGGGWLTAFNDTSSGVNEVRVRVFDNQGVASNADQQISDGAANNDYLGNVVALANGGAAVSIQKNATASDEDIIVKVLAANGAIVKTINVETADNIHSVDPSVAQLKNGGLAVAWSEVQADLSQDLYLRRYDASFNALAPKILIDGAGSVNGAVEVLALKDGGYAVAYQDNGYIGRGGQDISLRIFNADGSARSGLIRANGDAVAGIQSHPHMTELDNGFIAVAWDTASGITPTLTDVATRIFAPDGTALAATAIVAQGAATAEALGDLQGIGGGGLLYAFETGDPAADAPPSAVALQQAVFYRVIQGDNSNEMLSGDELNDGIRGGGGNDGLSGAGGDDSLSGGMGADTLSGGSGFNTLIYSDSAAGVSINLATGAASGGEADGDVFALGEFNGVTGSQFNDVLTGGGGNDVLVGLGGDDELNGGDGDDVLKGEQGNDHYVHSAGADIFSDWSGTSDWVDYSAAAASVAVTMGDGTAEQGAAAGDLVGAGIEWLTGSAFNDTLTGSDLADKIMGGAGADLISGGKGADTLDGDAGPDTLSYAGSAAAVTISLAANTTSGGDAEGDAISGFERIVGSDFDDKLAGNAGANLLTGGLGADKLTGGTGKDTFVYAGLADSTLNAAGRDQIKDFDASESDRIDLSAIDASSALDGNNAFSFIGSGAFTAYGQVRAYQVAANTFVEVNAEGDNAADLRITLVGLHTLDEFSFVL